MTDPDIKYIIRRMSAIVSIGMDLLFWSTAQRDAETVQLCERMNVLLEVIQQDLERLNSITGVGEAC